MENDVVEPKNPRKRARLAVVRKGCIQARKRCENSKRPGPVADHNSLRNQDKVLRTSKKNVKLNYKLSLANCTWKTSNQGGKRVSNLKYTCCARLDCYREYSTAAGGKGELGVMISSMRKYYHSLSYEGQREWWANRDDYAGYERGETPTPMRKHVKLSTFLCEPFAELTSKLASTNTCDKLQPLNAHTAVTVCSKFLQFLSGGHHDTKDQHWIRKAAFNSPEGATPEDLDCSLPHSRAQYGRTQGRNCGEVLTDVRL